MRLTSLLMLGSLVGCSGAVDIFYRGDKPDRKSTHVDFIPYLQVLERDLGNIDIPVVYGSAKEGETWVGACYKWKYSSYREIVIDTKYWISASESARYQLLLHEIGHCKYDKGHNDTYDIFSCPKSVMTTYIFSTTELFDCFDPKFDYYVNEIK